MDQLIEFFAHKFIIVFQFWKDYLLRIGDTSFQVVII